MSPEEEAQLRHLMRKGRELPMPMSALFGRVSKRFSSSAPKMPSIKQQAEEQKRQNKNKKKT